MEEILTQEVVKLKIQPDLSWAAFNGFSLLFDNPINVKKADENGLTLLNTGDNSDSSLSFYKTLSDIIQYSSIQTWVDNRQLALLPSSTYHVTAWDGLNDGNINKVDLTFYDELEAYLNHLPKSFSGNSIFTDPVLAQMDIFAADWQIEFGFDALVVRSNCQALAIRLKPIGAHSTQALEKWKIIRKKLNGIYQRFSVDTSAEDFVPHISLGYFANETAMLEALGSLTELEQHFDEMLSNSSIAFNKIGLYCFTDMVSFYRR